VSGFRRLKIDPIRIGILALLFLQAIRFEPAFAQAWLPGKGRGQVSISYKNFYIKEHSDANGLRLDRGRIRSNVVALDIDYGLTRRWAVNANVPHSSVKYTGNFPHVDPEHNIDDGDYHRGVQDLRFGLRYALLRYTPVIVTPFAEAVIPSHNYVTFAHSALGRNLNELMIGANVGWKGSETFLPNAYVQSRLSYGFVEKVLGRSHNRTNIDTEFTYFLTPRLAVSALTSYAKHHGGLDWDSTKGAPAQVWTPEELLHHDELVRADAFDIGLGTAFRLHASTSVYANILHTTWSINGHPLSTGLILGFNRSFRTRRPPPLPIEP
jgi:hypothetical protein